MPNQGLVPDYFDIKIFALDIKENIFQTTHQSPGVVRKVPSISTVRALASNFSWSLVLQLNEYAELAK